MGQYYSSPIITTGASWAYRTDVDKWVTSSYDASTDGYYVTNPGGGTWYEESSNGSTYNQLFSKYTNNLQARVTEYVKDWLNATTVNNGFLIKRPNNQESGNIHYGSSKFFSNETHTIYVPTLEIRWDDSVFNTGSLEELTDDNIAVYTKTQKTEYKELSKSKIRIVGRAKYNERTFSDSSLQTTVKYLPETTYYQVRDVETDLVLIPFDTDNTKVSCDTYGNYFNFWFNALHPDRYYQFNYRVDRNGTQEYFNGNIFKVIK